MENATPQRSAGYFEACESLRGRVIGSECVFDYPKVNPTPMDPKSECQASGGKWRRFPTACTDTCEFEIPEICAAVIVDDCDCGRNRCFYGGSCVENPDWHHYYPQE